MYPCAINPSPLLRQMRRVIFPILITLLFWGFGTALLLLANAPLHAQAPVPFSCTSVTELTAVECNALKALYESTNGNAWINKTNWLQTITPCARDGSGWYGIVCSATTPRRVIEINLSSNNLLGALPAQLSDLTELTKLDLSVNNTSGDLPLALCQLKKLQKMYLGGRMNQGQTHTGTLPTCLGDMSALIDLRISKTNISGAIPPDLGKLKLQNLSLPSNQLSGPLPPIFTDTMSNLRTLDLINNNLTGVLTDSLATLHNLQRLELTGNDFTGEIPPWLGNLTALQRVRLGMNHFTGTIPAIGAQLHRLTELELANNLLSGEILSSFATLPLTLTLTISHNMLTASDPAVLAWLNTVVPGWQQFQDLTPANVQVTAVQSTSVQLTWNSVTNQSVPGFMEVAYPTTTPLLYKSGPYTETAKTPDKTATTIKVNNLCPGTTYKFAVRTQTPPHGNQRNRVVTPPSQPIVITTVNRTVDLLLLPILAIDSNLEKHYAEYIGGIAEATARDTSILALVLLDTHTVSDTNTIGDGLPGNALQTQGITRILKIQCGQVERLPGLPSLDLPAHQLDPDLREYDMTNPHQLAAFIRWARTTLGGDAPAGDPSALKTVVSYVGHGLPLAPATDIARLISGTVNLADAADFAPAPLGLPPLPTKIPATPDQLTDQTSLTLISPYSLTQALRLATDNGAKPITVLDLVHCFGGTLEELYELSNPGGQPVAEMVVASPNYAYAGAATFIKMLPAINPTQTAKEMARAIFTAYDAALKEADGYDNDATSVEHPRIMAAVELSKVPAIKAQVDALAGVMMARFATDEEIKAKLLAAHSASIHYDTVPSTYPDDKDPATSCPHDFKLTAHDGLSDLTSFAAQVRLNFPDDAVQTIVLALYAAVNAAVEKPTPQPGIPWFADTPVLEQWRFTSTSGIALYTDFHGITVGETTYIGWQAHWYTDTVSSDNPHPYQIAQGDSPTWADVIQMYWADELGGNEVKTLACITQLPRLRPRNLYLPLILR